MKKRALLLYPPQHCLIDPFRIWTFDYAANFPLGLLRLSTFLKLKGYEIDYLDAFNVFENTEDTFQRIFTDENIVRNARCGNFEKEKKYKPVYHVGLSYKEIENRLKDLSEAPDEVYISSIFTWSWKTTHECVRLVKRTFPKSHVKLGGIYPTLCPDHARSSGADEIVEKHIPEVQSSWIDAAIIKQHAIPYEDAVVVKTSIGCPHNCSYCAVHVLEGRQLIFRDPEDVVHEMESLSGKLEARKFYFWESNILMRAHDHLLKILSLIKERRLSFILQAPEGFQPNLITPEIANSLKEGGFRQITLTLETTDAQRIRQANRPADIADVESAILALKQSGFSGHDIMVVLLIAQPQQTLDSVLKDIIHVYRSGAMVSFLIYTPIPNTRDFKEYASLFEDRKLEDLDSFLYPLASQALSVDQIDTLIKYFNFRYYPLERIMESNTEDAIITRMQKLITITP